MYVQSVSEDQLSLRLSPSQGQITPSNYPSHGQTTASKMSEKGKKILQHKRQKHKRHTDCHQHKRQKHKRTEIEEVSVVWRDNEFTDNEMRETTDQALQKSSDLKDFQREVSGNISQVVDNLPAGFPRGRHKPACIPIETANSLENIETV